MKKVWILEKFASTEEMARSYEMYKETLEQIKTEGKYEATIADFESVVANYGKMMTENPEGRWYGFEGKIVYKQFCDVAKAAIRRNPEGKFRVVEGEIEDNAEYWTGYNVIKVNDGVLRYLMATK